MCHRGSPKPAASAAAAAEPTDCPSRLLTAHDTSTRLTRKPMGDHDARACPPQHGPLPLSKRQQKPKSRCHIQKIPANNELIKSENEPMPRIETAN